MRIKLDENLPVSLAVGLTERGHDVETVAEEGLVGATDPAVLGAAISEERMIFTLDRGFGDIRAYPPGSYPGIVVFRVDDQSARAVTRAALASSIGTTSTTLPAPWPSLNRRPPSPSAAAIGRD